MKIYKRLFMQNKGVTTIEFALILPILLLISMGTLELGLIAYAQVVLEGATNSAGRIGKTGQTNGGVSREVTIQNEVKRLSSGLMDPSKITFAITAYKDNNFAGGIPNSAGGAGDMVVLQATYPWNIVTPGVAAFFPNPYPVTARAAIRNEPF